MTRNLRGKTFPDIVLAARSLRKNETEAEKKLWLELRNGNLGKIKFRRQHPIGNFVVDFYCVKCQLAIEVDGGIHDSLEQHLLDAKREEALSHKGISILRFTNSDVMNNMVKVKEIIMQSIDEISKKNLITIHPSPDSQERERG